MWAIRSEKLLDGRGLQFAVSFGREQATFDQILNAWQGDAEFRSLFNKSLAEATFSAFRWETPPVTSATVDRAFEFVLLDSPGLVRQPDPEAFSEHYGDHSGTSVVAFPNLGGDAIMVVPRPIGANTAYGHLAAFVRGAPKAQQHALWQVVARTMSKRLGIKPVWLSTAGAGVSWLHVRLDDRPKYYGYEPYRH